MIKLGIIEDDAGIRQRFEKYFSFQSGIECVLIAESVESFIEKAGSVKEVNVLLSDIGLPGVSGIEGIPLVKKVFPNCNILMITVYAESERIFNALCAGANGYLLKSTPLPKVKEAIENINNGDAAMSPSIARKVIDYFQPRQKKERNKKEQLTKREKQIVQGIVDGLSYKMIAARHDISFQTVKQHIKNIYRKLHINSKAELISKSFKGELD